MKTVYIKRDQFGFAYKTEANSIGWKYMPGSIKDAAAIQKYFEEGRDQPTAGKHDPPQLSFVDEANRPTVYYSVKGKKITANFDSGKILNIDPDHFLNPRDQIDFLKTRTDEKIVEEGDAMETDREERDHLLRKAIPETVKSFETLIHEHMTPDAIESYCRGHAEKHYNSGSVVSFEE